MNLHDVLTVQSALHVHDLLSLKSERSVVGSQFVNASYCGLGYSAQCSLVICGEQGYQEHTIPNPKSGGFHEQITKSIYYWK